MLYVANLNLICAMKTGASAFIAVAIGISVLEYVNIIVKMLQQSAE